MPEAKLEDMFREELENLYDAEKQIVEALPKMIAASSSHELASALQLHLDETKEQVSRLDRIFEAMGEQPGGPVSGYARHSGRRGQPHRQK